MEKSLSDRALAFHAAKPEGKLSVSTAKKIHSKEDLALAYSPGVGACIEAIQKNEDLAYKYTNIGHLCAVITNATAVLGYGSTSPRAAKPVMEGKAAIIKSFSGLDAIDIEIDETDEDKFIEIVRSISPSFGAILLEDIKAPDCFYIEEQLQKKCNMPVFHDDQHGTAIVVAAGLLNALKVQGTSIAESSVCIIGSGAAGYAIFLTLLSLGFTQQQIIVCDRSGPLTQSRNNLNNYKAKMVHPSFNGNTTIAVRNANIVIGVAQSGILTVEDIRSMPEKPIIFALSNPIPEIMPNLVNEHRPDAIIATGRSDFANQVNNVLVFPYLLKGLIKDRNNRLTDSLKSSIAHYVASLVNPTQNQILPDIFDERLIEIVKIVESETCN